MSQSKRALLIILDGFGIATNKDVSAVDKAHKPFYDALVKEWPHSTLSASGEDVGLPEGQFGNSEVGHLNIGAGRIVWQELSRINKSIREQDFFENEVLAKAFNKAKENGRIHFMGLFSDGGVHSHNQHLFALLEMAKHRGVNQAFVHAFTDGRDTSPNGGIEYAKEFQAMADKAGVGTLASVVGRYYAMDRDNRWERTELAYRLLTEGEGTEVPNAETAFRQSYHNDVTDEFIKPHLIKTESDSRIRPGDVVVYYNIRGDRARQITKALCSFDEVPFSRKELNLHYVTFTSYDDTFENVVQVAYPPVRMVNTLGEYISNKGLKQLRIAETEKYPHVTYFFNGGEENPNPGEERIMIPSPKVPTYDLQPEMSADKLTEALIRELENQNHDLAIINFANPDMVGHTGNMGATIRAIEFIDKKLKQIVESAREHNYEIMIISDHGNADCMLQDDGSAHTAHTTALVPSIVIKNEERDLTLTNGILADVAPTLLKLLELEQPEEMTGQSIF